MLALYNADTSEEAVTKFDRIKGHVKVLKIFQEHRYDPDTALRMYMDIVREDVEWLKKNNAAREEAAKGFRQRARVFQVHAVGGVATNHTGRYETYPESADFQKEMLEEAIANAVKAADIDATIVSGRALTELRALCEKAKSNTTQEPLRLRAYSVDIS